MGVRKIPRTIECGRDILGKQDLWAISQIVEEGGVIVYPTETLYGMGADPKNADAANRIFQIKRRPAIEGVSVAFLSIGQVEAWVKLPPMAKNLLEEHTPGPLTVLVPSKLMVETALPPSTLFGIRIPSHPVARQLLDATGPLVSTSANRHGQPSTQAEALLVGEESDVTILAEGVCGGGSTVVSVENEEIKIIRSGPIDVTR